MDKGIVLIQDFFNNLKGLYCSVVPSIPIVYQIPLNSVSFLSNVKQNHKSKGSHTIPAVFPIISMKKFSIEQHKIKLSHKGLSHVLQCHPVLWFYFSTEPSTHTQKEKNQNFRGDPLNCSSDESVELGSRVQKETINNPVWDNFTNKVPLSAKATGEIQFSWKWRRMRGSL